MTKIKYRFIPFQELDDLQLLGVDIKEMLESSDYIGRFVRCRLCSVRRSNVCVHCDNLKFISETKDYVIKEARFDKNNVLTGVYLEHPINKVNHGHDFGRLFTSRNEVKIYLKSIKE